MTMQRLLAALTLANLGLLVLLLGQARLPDAHGADSVLRGRALEIVDDQGRVRASVKVQPAGTANGQPYPETVILRLIDPNGRPSVKLAGLGAGRRAQPGGRVGRDPCHLEGRGRERVPEADGQGRPGAAHQAVDRHL